MRAAASSIASGSPSSRRQISATAAAFVVGQREVRRRPPAPARRRARTASDRGQVADGCRRRGRAAPAAAPANSCSPQSAARARLVTRTCSRGQAASRSATSGAAGDDVLEVVEHQQEVAIAQRHRRGSRAADAGRDPGPRPLRPSPAARAPGRAPAQLDEGDPVGDCGGELGCHGERQPRLAHPAGTGQRQEAAIAIME